MTVHILYILLSMLFGTLSQPANACSVHDHNCAFHGIGRAVNQTIDQNSPTSVVIGTIGSNDIDFDNHVLLPDGNGPYIVSSAGFTPRSDQPYIDPTQQPRHLYPTQFQIDFQNGSAQATYSGDVTGGVVIPGAQPCTIGTAQYCEEVRIIGNIPDPGTPEGFVVRQTNHLYNFPNTPNPSIDLISYGVATGRAYFKRQSHLGYPETIDYNGQALQLAGIRQETLSGTGDQGREQTYYIGYNDFDAHAAGVVVHNDQKKLIGSDVYAVQFGHQKTPNGDIFKYDGLQRKNTYIKYDRTYDFTKYAYADTGLPALEMTNNETARWNTWSNYYAAQHTKEYTKYQNDLEAQRVLDREKFERDIARGCLDSICSNLSQRTIWPNTQSVLFDTIQEINFWEARDLYTSGFSGDIYVDATKLDILILEDRHITLSVDDYLVHGQTWVDDGEMSSGNYDFEYHGDYLSSDFITTSRNLGTSIGRIAHGEDIRGDDVSNGFTIHYEGTPVVIEPTPLNFGGILLYNTRYANPVYYVDWAIDGQNNADQTFREFQTLGN